MNTFFNMIELKEVMRIPKSGELQKQRGVSR
jgi:hypothetical protein